MKIIFLISSLGAGGAERVAATLCNAWAARGDQVTLIPTFSGRDKPFYKTPEPVELIYLADIVGVKRRSLMSYAKRLLTLRKLIKERQPDVVISFLPNVNVASILASAFLAIPTIICERRDPSSQPTTRLLEFGCRLVYRYANILTVQTEIAAESVKKIYPRLNQVHSIPNPLPDGVVDFANHHALLPSKRILLSIGRLSAEKQVNVIVDSFAVLAHRFQQWDLYIYGDGPQKQSIQHQICNLSLEGRVFLKEITNQPWQVMADADAFVMASKYEGFPNSLLEAMGVGLPCVAFDCPSGPRDVSNNGKYAMLVKKDDETGLVAALERIMSDELFRIELGKQARASIFERYRLSEVLNRWDQLFRDVRVIT